MIHDCSFVLCWLFMSPLFVLNSWTEHCSSDKSSTFCRFCSFPAFLHIWNPFQQWLYDFEIHLFTLRTIEGLKHKLLKKVKHSLMLQKNTRRIKSWLLKTFEQDEDFQLFSFVEIYIFFHLLLPFGSNRRYLHVSRKTNEVQFTLIFKFKKFSPPGS